ncbi:uncharacterized protein LOC108735541 [Agrilus planipennis]|uniref:Uncharacterized protein LOC108735541 n=1 Tax=Agrilus planipennis TaxID=224129 RepID=A0A7F5R981_AGRPL|nr:uncharacterized protein LOC108735541 [Agrilus planipennis]
MTQHYFVRGIRKTVGEFAKSSAPLYFYKFTYVTKENYTKGVNGGAGHAEEGKYTWHSTTLANENDIRMKDRMVTLWTNFAIYGNPTPKADALFNNVIWPEAHTDVPSKDDLRYLELGYDLVPGISPDQADFLFWRNLFQKYATTTVYTY